MSADLILGSIWPPMLAHVFCNLMGFPNPGYALQQNPEGRGRECLSKEVWILADFIAGIMTAYVVGIVAFVVGLRRL